MRNMQVNEKITSNKKQASACRPKKKTSDKVVLITEDPEPIKVKLDQQESPFESETPSTNGTSVFNTQSLERLLLKRKKLIGGLCLTGRLREALSHV